MIKRTYKCTKCNHQQDIILNSIFDEKPKSIPCEKCNSEAVYDLGQLKSSHTIIPEKMKALGDTSMDYSKISRDKRRFY